MSNLPHSPQTEQAILGTLMYFPSTIFGILDNFDPKYFFEPAYVIVAQAIYDLGIQNKPSDIRLVYERLREKGEIQKVGDLEGLRRLLEISVSPDLCHHWLDILKKFWSMRFIMEACAEIIHRGKKCSEDNIPEWMGYAEERFSIISEEIVKSDMQTSDDIVDVTLLDLQERIKNRGKIMGVPSSFPVLDNITGGFNPSDLIIIGARPGMGKTAFILNIISNAVLNLQKTVVMFSLEMKSTQLMQRMLSTHARVNGSKFRTGEVNDVDIDKILLSVPEFKNKILLFNDKSSINFLSIASECRKLKRQNKPVDLVVIDYLQLMSATGTKAQNREREVSEITRSLKGLAKELNCPIIALSQLNRNLENRQDKRPICADLRESGAVEQDSDLILFLYRDKKYNLESLEQDIAEVIIGKNRHGEDGTVKLGFEGKYFQFYNLETV